MTDSSQVDEAREAETRPQQPHRLQIGDQIYIAFPWNEAAKKKCEEVEEAIRIDERARAQTDNENMRAALSVITACHSDWGEKAHWWLRWIDVRVPGFLTDRTDPTKAEAIAEWEALHPLPPFQERQIAQMLDRLSSATDQPLPPTPNPILES